MEVNYTDFERLTNFTHQALGEIPQYIDEGDLFQTWVKRFLNLPDFDIWFLIFDPHLSRIETLYTSMDLTGEHSANPIEVNIPLGFQSIFSQNLSPKSVFQLATGSFIKQLKRNLPPPKLAPNHFTIFNFLLRKGKYIACIGLSGKNMSLHYQLHLFSVSNQCHLLLEMLEERKQRLYYEKKLNKSAILHEASSALFHLHRVFYTLLELSNEDISYERTLEVALTEIVSAAASRFSIILAHSSFYLKEKDGQQLELKAEEGGVYNGSQILYQKQIPIATSFLGRTLTEKKTNIALLENTTCILNKNLFPRLSLLAVPILTKQEAIGTMNFIVEDIPNIDHIDRETLDFFTAITNPLASIIERKRAEHEAFSHTIALKRANKALKKLDKLKTIFLASVSHEFRTPLTSILGFSKILKKKLTAAIFPNLPEDSPITTAAVASIEDYVEIIINESRRLTDMVNNVLDISKMESDNFEWNMQPHDLVQIIQQAVKSTALMVNEKGLKLELHLADQPIYILCDHDRILQVVLNLMSNAINHTPEGTISISMEESSSSVNVLVEDTGIGIPPPLTKTIFEKFKQIGDTLTNKPKGTGLGLPICKHIVEKHAGVIIVEAGIRQGSIFSFTLPLLQENQEKLPG